MADASSNLSPDASFGSLKRTLSASDQAFGASVASQIAQLATEDSLDLNDARVVFQGSDGAAGLIPGSNSLCFVATSALAGVVSQCVSPSVVNYQGIGIVTTIQNATLAQGVVPDGVTGVEFTLADGTTQDMALSADNGYIQLLRARPVAITYLAEGRVLGQNRLEDGTPHAYE